MGKQPSHVYVGEAILLNTSTIGQNISNSSAKYWINDYTH